MLDNLLRPTSFTWIFGWQRVHTFTIFFLPRFSYLLFLSFSFPPFFHSLSSVRVPTHIHTFCIHFLSGCQFKWCRWHTLASMALGQDSKQNKNIDSEQQTNGTHKSVNKCKQIDIRSMKSYFNSKIKFIFLRKWKKTYSPDQSTACDHSTNEWILITETNWPSATSNKEIAKRYMSIYGIRLPKMDFCVLVS